ncbi:ferredoxin reductase [Cryobacterium sp. TMT2-15-1]|uniref:FAD-dependent oxidoreductase n=1 Tax=Cryobacterium sp. TMT2-15-1 TaxID=1259246 RepID=UPI00106BC268|nr:FAD-dependent oxidoreductase [Cryobacterium sp. TMT2-15-1]TFC63144.1 ferredoxin reductase [Cryobacterium sp. TMT2-15-1]
MSHPHVLVIGAGAAGTAAARVFASATAITVTLVGRTGETPYNRTLVTKGIAVGLLTPEQTALPGVNALLDTAIRIETAERRVYLASGVSAGYDALLVATGSIPRGLPIPGADDAAAAGRLTTLHSVADAIRVRDALAAVGRPGRIVISGAGLVAGETATLLREKGHHVTLLARSSLPGVTVFGQELAGRLADAHRAHLATAFGRAPISIRLDGAELSIQLDDGSSLEADLFVVAHGTTPEAPAPWNEGVGVDETLRAAEVGVYAAGGAANHHDDLLGTWRIDHWAEAVAQGEHAARAILADLGVGADPGRYRPRASFTAVMSGSMVAGAGLTGTGVSMRVESADPLVVVNEHNGVPIGVIGMDAVPSVFSWMPRLHATFDPVGEAAELVASRTSVAPESTKR